MRVKVAWFFCVMLPLYFRPPNCVLKQNTLVYLHHALLGLFPVCNNIFPFSINADFILLGFGIQMNVLKDCIIFLILVVLILLNFHLQQKHIFLFWGFTENGSFISFSGVIWPKYSEINGYKIRKDLSFQK